MAQRVAFLIGNQTFSPDSGLLPLQGPANDVAAFARLLRDPECGRFKVHEFLDKPSHEVLPDLAHALSVAASGDLFLIYYSGHGKLDRSGRLCLATANTRQGSLRATSIPARHISELVEESDCNQVVLFLDCCYSGAIEEGLKGNLSDELHVVEDARGFYIITASTGLQTARETASVPGGAVMGRFTAALVNGIESGAADLEHKGKILLSDLRRHLGQVVTGHTPQFFARRASGDPLICFSPATAAPPLDAGVLADLDAEQWHRRRGAVSALASVLRDGNAAARATAKTALQRRLEQERDYYVRAELEEALAPQGAATSEVPRSATPMHAKTAAPSMTEKQKELVHEVFDTSMLPPQEIPHSGSTIPNPNSPLKSPIWISLLKQELTRLSLHWRTIVALLILIVALAFNLSTAPTKRTETREDTATRAGILLSAGQNTEAAEAYKAAADKGHAWSQYSLARLYETGQGVQQSYIEAARLYKAAAEQDTPVAQSGLGRLYETGQGVQQSYLEAARLYKLAADRGNISAQANLGRLYENGQGVEKSVAVALEWYGKAARQGDTTAQSALRRLGRAW